MKCVSISSDNPSEVILYRCGEDMDKSKEYKVKVGFNLEWQRERILHS